MGWSQGSLVHMPFSAIYSPASNSGDHQVWKVKWGQGRPGKSWELTKELTCLAFTSNVLETEGRWPQESVLQRTAWKGTHSVSGTSVIISTETYPGSCIREKGNHMDIHAKKVTFNMENKAGCLQTLPQVPCDAGRHWKEMSPGFRGKEIGVEHCYTQPSCLSNVPTLQTNKSTSKHTGIPFVF